MMVAAAICIGLGLSNLHFALDPKCPLRFLSWFGIGFSSTIGVAILVGSFVNV